MHDLPPATVKALTSPAAWARCKGNDRAMALDQIDDAQRQVTAAPDRAARAAMLSRLPPHIAEIVKARVAALWGGGRVIMATDASPDGRREAMQVAADRGGTVHVLDGENATWVVVKEKGP